jgi:hypothetical protein
MYNGVDDGVIEAHMLLPLLEPLGRVQRRKCDLWSGRAEFKEMVVFKLLHVLQRGHCGKCRFTWPFLAFLHQAS